jgi:hypothetical protein
VALGPVPQYAERYFQFAALGFLDHVQV